MDTSSIKYGPGVTAEVGQDAAIGAYPGGALHRSGGRQDDAYEVAFPASKLPVSSTCAFQRSGSTRLMVVRGSDRVRERCRRRWVCRGRRRLGDRYRQSGKSLATWPADFLTYVNAPIGQGNQCRSAQTADRYTDHRRHRQRNDRCGDFRSDRDARQNWHRPSGPATGLGHRRSVNTVALPPMVTASSALDVLSHAIESFTALPFNAVRRRPGPACARLTRAPIPFQRYLVEQSHDHGRALFTAGFGTTG